MTRRLAAVPEHPARAIIYVRVSKVGDRGEDLTSPELQEHACREYCARRGYVIAEILTDIDRTGRSWSKRQVENAVRTIEAGGADLIVCWRFSRFTRNLRDYVIQTARIETAGGRLEAALEEVDPATAAGLMQRDLFAILAQWESRKIGEAWKETHARRRREGLGHSSYPRLGYRHVGKGFELDPQSAPLVVEMYRRYLAGEGYRAIAEWLNGLGVPHPRSGREWKPTGPRRTMESGWAAGLIRVGGAWIDGAHEPIIDARTWRAYLRERTRRQDMPARLIKPVTALSGLMICSGCQRSMRVKRLPPHADGRPRRPTYVCETFECPLRCHVSVRLATEAVLAWLRPMVTDQDVSAATKAIDGAARAVARADRDRVNKKLVQVETRLTRLTMDLAAGLVKPAEYPSARDGYIAERRKLEAVSGDLEDTLERPVPSRAAIKRVLDAWDGSDDQARNRALRDLVWKVEVSRPPDGTFRSLIRPFGAWERS